MYCKDPEMNCFSVIMCLAMENCHGAIRQIIYQAEGISYSFSVVMYLSVKKLSWSSPTDSPPGCRDLFPTAYTVSFFGTSLMTTRPSYSLRLSWSRIEIPYLYDILEKSESYRSQGSRIMVKIKIKTVLFFRYYTQFS